MINTILLFQVEVEASMLKDALPPTESSTHHHQHHVNSEDEGYGSMARVHRRTTTTSPVSILKKDRVPSNEGTKDRDNGPHSLNVRRVHFHNRVERYQYPAEPRESPPPVSRTRRSNTQQHSSDSSTSEPVVYSLGVAMYL